ncbi:MAG TPA: tRNA-binding protein [Candidatus Absconditabacterales bacterium]|nr:tRNA-binding protein [Candidatus Absconditabacterales bacterium]HMT27287.1 tRNA-binding protein [Candidatus Absconditabacterales bacterium]
METIGWGDFEKVEMRVGTIISAQPNVKATKPALVLKVDFGEHGIKSSSAQITQNYSPDSLIGRQVIAVMNFPAKQIANIVSEVLILGALDPVKGVILLSVDKIVENGSLVH